MIYPVCREIFNLCMGLWAYFGDYNAVDSHDLSKEHHVVDL